MKRNIWVMIKGKFQNNIFGCFSQEAANTFGISGMFSLLDESTAIIEAEGDNNSLGGFVQLITNGKFFGSVKSYEIRNGILSNYPFFHVKKNHKEVENVNSIIDINGLYLP